ncbi:MAG: hypothetical protein IPI00_00170 [Flavobacteriales bacterium]|nr:hypothetical protein [Flavobacteriales bacterium]
MDIYDKFALALLKSGQTANAYELVDGAVTHGYMESTNGSIIRQKLKSLDERFRGNFGSTTSYEQAEQLLEKNVAELRAMNALDAHIEFIDLVKAYIAGRSAGVNTVNNATDGSNQSPKIIKVGRDEKTFLRLVYQVNGRQVTVDLEESESNSGRILSGRYRQVVESPFGGVMSIGQLTAANDLIAEVSLLMQCLDKTNLKKQDFWDAFVQLIVQHTNKHGKLVDFDLDGFIDTMLIVVDSIASAFNWPPLSNTDGITLRKEFYDAATKAFRELIWVRDPWQDNLLGQPTKFIRLADQ